MPCCRDAVPQADSQLEEWGGEQGQGLGEKSMCERLELRYMVVALEEDAAQRRQAKSHSPSGAHIALVPRVDEKTGIDLLPHDEDRRDSSFLCKHTFSGW